ALDVYRLIQTIGYAVLDLRSDLFLADLRSTKEDVTVAGHGDDDGVIFIGILHVLGGIGPGQVHRMVLLQHGCHDHEDDQQHEHDIRHGNDVGSRHLTPG